MLPDILNKNNQSVRDEFSYIFDSSNGRLVRSVYVPQGSVKAHFGDFQNISVDNISIGNPDPVINIIRKNIDRFSHNEFIDNFSSDEIMNNYKETVYPTETNICHDASVIGLPVYSHKKFLAFGDAEVPTVYNVIDRCITKIEALEKQVSKLQTELDNTAAARYTRPASSGIMTFAERGDNRIITETTVYPKSYVGATAVHLKRLSVPKTHIVDLTSGRFMTYYPADTNIEVSNTNLNFIETDTIGCVVNLELVKTTAAPFKILLNRESGKAVRLSTNELNRIQLRCTGYTEEYGPEWDIHSYSVPAKSDIEVVRI